LIRIWDTANGELLQELRRGADRAEIFSISFNFNACWLAVSSDKGTVHVFSLVAPDADQNRPPTAPGADHDPETTDSAVINPKSSLSFMKGILPKYFSSEWSFAQFRVPEGKTITAFGPEPNTIIVISAGGSFYKCFFDPRKGGECIQKDYHNFLDSASDP